MEAGLHKVHCILNSSIVSGMDLRSPSFVHTAPAPDIQTPGWDKRSLKAVIKLLAMRKLELIKFHDGMPYTQLLALLSEASV